MLKLIDGHANVLGGAWGSSGGPWGSWGALGALGEAIGRAKALGYLT